MKNEIQNKLLIALDGSEHAFNAIKYVGKLVSFHKMNVVLFNVFSSVPESYQDLEKDPYLGQAAGEIMAWEMQQKKVIKEYMDKAKQTLLRSGFSKMQLQ